MVSSALAGFLGRRDIHYGWVVVGVTFLTMLVTAGAMGAPGVLIVPLEHEFGWDNAQISSALAIRLLLFGLFGPFAAAFMNRFGLRRVMISAAALIVAGLVVSLAMTQVWQLILLWGFVVGIGTGLTAIVLAATVATRWFTQRRGLVVGLLSASSATGQLVFLPLIAELTTRFGWRTAIIFVCGLLALAAATAFALMRDRPSDLNLPAVWRNRGNAAAPIGAGLLSLLSSPLMVLADAARVPLFWVLFATLLHLRFEHQRADPDPFHHVVRRLRADRRDCGERARHDGRIRFCRHHRLRLVVRSLRQSLAVVLVLRAARAFAAVSAVHRLFVLRAFAVCRVLRARLDRDGAAHRQADC